MATWPEGWLTIFYNDILVGLENGNIELPEIIGKQEKDTFVQAKLGNNICRSEQLWMR